MLYIDAFRRASAHEITAVIPYYPYGRQERMARGREAISAKVVATMLESMGVGRVIYFDVHAPATQGFFDVPVDPLSALPALVEYFDKPEFADAAIVSPDVGPGEVRRPLCRGLEPAPGRNAQAPGERREGQGIARGRRHRRAKCRSSSTTSSRAAACWTNWTRCTRPAPAKRRTSPSPTASCSIPRSSGWKTRGSRGWSFRTRSASPSRSGTTRRSPSCRSPRLLAAVITRIHLGKSISDLMDTAKV